MKGSGFRVIVIGNPEPLYETHSWNSEPQNIEQGISNYEVWNRCALSLAITKSDRSCIMKSNTLNIVKRLPYISLVLSAVALLIHFYYPLRPHLLYKNGTGGWRILATGFMSLGPPEYGSPVLVDIDVFCSGVFLRNHGSPKIYHYHWNLFHSHSSDDLDCHAAS